MVSPFMASGNRPSTLALGLGLALVALFPACKAKIGDPCKRAYDCGVTVQRQCDMSNASNDPAGKGECTLENCSLGICPDEAVCIKVYAAEFLSIACDPDQEDIGVGVWNEDEPCVPSEEDFGRDDCGLQELCVGVDGSESEGFCAPRVDDCEIHEVCLPEGLCADEISARSSCRLMCDDDSDCRSNYMCKTTNADGVYVAPDPDDPDREIIRRICVPDPS
jgi:hypothetical protein